MPKWVAIRAKRRARTEVIGEVTEVIEGQSCLLESGTGVVSSKKDDRGGRFVAESE